MDTVVSMNLWGFDHSFLDTLEPRFAEFLKNNDNPLKGEFFLPFIVDDMIKNEGAKVRVLTTEDKWYGVTYKEDAQSVKDAILDMTKRGIYDGI
jgi:hypothetical protein